MVPGMSASTMQANFTALISAVGGISGGGTGSYTDISTTMTLGGTSQLLVAANAVRKGVLVNNPSSEIESVFVNFGAAATAANSVELVPGAAQFFPTIQAVHVLAATTGHAVIAKELA